MTRSHEPEPPGGRPIHQAGADGAPVAVATTARARSGPTPEPGSATSLRATPTIRRYGSPTTRSSTS